MFRDPEGGKVVNTDYFEDDPTYADEVNMDFQKGSGAKDTYCPLSISNPTI